MVPPIPDIKRVDTAGLYQAAGFFNVSINYEGSVVKRSTAGSALDCYSQCKAFNGTYFCSHIIYPPTVLHSFK